MFDEVFGAVKGRRSFVCGRPVQHIFGLVLRVWEHLEAQVADGMVDCRVVIGKSLHTEHMISVQSVGEVFLGQICAENMLAYLSKPRFDQHRTPTE